MSEYIPSALETLVLTALESWYTRAQVFQVNMCAQVNPDLRYMCALWFDSNIYPYPLTTSKTTVYFTILKYEKQV